MNANTRKILLLCDGVRPSTEIARIVGVGARYCRKVANKHGAPLPRPGPPSGSRNPAWVGGRAVTRDGYAMVPGGKEHRVIMAQTLGRPLRRGEVVDHIDGLTLHNSIENLRLFASNAEHLRATITGSERRWSAAGRANIGARTDRGRVIEPVDSYRQRKEAGDVRLRQILLVALRLGIDSPYLCGTTHWMEQAGIDWRSRPSLERAHQAILDAWEWDRDPLL